MTEYGPQPDIIMWAGVIGFLVGSALAYPVYRLLLALKSRQTVSQYAPEGHQKKQGTPTMGGIIIVVGGLAGIVYAMIAMPGRIPNYDIDPLLAAAVLLLGFGFTGFTVDFLVPRLMKGKRGLGWKQKIVMQFVVAAVAAWIDHRNFDLVWATVVFSILFFSNAYNFADGLDWLAGTLLLALGLGLVAVAWYANMFEGVTIFLPIMAAAIPFLVLNKPPAKLFMGDVGSLPIGAVIGYLIAAVVFLDAAPHLYSWGYGEHMGQPTFGMPYDALSRSGWGLAVLVLSLVMVAELVPVPMQIAWVKLFKRRLFPYTPIHHAFEKAGWREGRVVATFSACQLALSLAAWGIAIWWVGRHDQTVKDIAIQHVRSLR